MSEIEVRHANNVPAVADQPVNQTTGSVLEAWARDAIAISQIASNIANTSLAGAYQGRPDEVTAVILAGHELGLQPMTSLKSIDVIQKQPALRAHAMRGILQAQGHEIELVESSDIHCKMRGRRRGAEAWQEVVWDIPRATRLGLLGKDQWKKQPKTMLVARATGEICRLVASDALHGMPYAAEELDGRPNITVQQVAPNVPLSVVTLTAPPTPAETKRASGVDVESAGDDEADATSDSGWQPDRSADTDSTLWPPVAQPPQS